MYIIISVNKENSAINYLCLWYLIFKTFNFDSTMLGFFFTQSENTHRIIERSLGTEFTPNNIQKYNTEYKSMNVCM